jgi:hypothetical protein
MATLKKYFFFFCVAPLFTSLVGCSNNIVGQGSSLGLDCNTIDLFNPVFESGLTALLPAALTKSPQYQWTDAADFCGVDHYEVAIGTTIGGEEHTAWNPIGNVTTYRAEGLSLVDFTSYYFSVRAVDAAGNISSVVTSAAWKKLEPISDLPNMILRLNGEVASSILDGSGNIASHPSFNGNIQQWLDTSNSSTTHNWFSPLPANRPTFVSSENALQFSGTQMLSVADDVELNTGTVNQRNFILAFESGSNITSRQVVYDEGATVRGMNIYIQNGNLYCGFWNTNNDGDGIQPFVSVSSPITVNTRYSVSWVFDYLNYSGPAGPDGTLTCYLNGTQIGQVTSTSLLYAHSGDLGLGARRDGSYFHTGSAAGDGDFFSGKIMEVMIVDSVPSTDEITLINQYLMDKWSM